MKQSSWRFLAVLILNLPCLATEQVEEERLERGVITVDVFQAKKLFDSGATFIDVRADDEWHMGHIKNAVHVNFKTEFTKIQEIDRIKKNTPLVFYCNSSEGVSGAYASALSAYWGFSNVFYFREGYFSWLLQDFPTEMKVTARLKTSNRK